MGKGLCIQYMSIPKLRGGRGGRQAYVGRYAQVVRRTRIRNSSYYQLSLSSSPLRAIPFTITLGYSIVWVPSERQLPSRETASRSPA